MLSRGSVFRWTVVVERHAATWCAACTAELPRLTRLYEQYHPRGFEILSYSVDSTAAVVRQFRKDRFAMTWLHGIDPQLRAMHSPLAKDCDVQQILVQCWSGQTGSSSPWMKIVEGQSSKGS